MRKIILASKSPRRKELLRTIFGDKFVVEPSQYEEKNIKGISPKELAKKHALGKALDIAKRHDKGIVIGADVFVVLEGEILGKAKNKEEAFEMLKKQRGKWTEVVSGLAVIDIEKDINYVQNEVTKVKMANLTDDEIWAYVNTGDWKGKAGSFGMQDKAAVLVEKINGCYSNVIGLPLPRLHQILRELEVSIFKY